MKFKLICEECIKASPVISPMWFMFPHEEGTCGFCGKVGEVANMNKEPKEDK